MSQGLSQLHTRVIGGSSDLESKLQPPSYIRSLRVDWPLLGGVPVAVSDAATPPRLMVRSPGVTWRPGRQAGAGPPATPATSHRPEDQPHPGHVEGAEGGAPPDPPHRLC